MASITLIRHGQASFGAENYDQLSPLGYQQAEHLGRFFNDTGRRVEGIIMGGMDRHQQSYESFAKMFSHLGGFQPLVMPEFNEFDHEQVLLIGNNLSHKSEIGELVAHADNPKATIFTLFSKAVARWQSGQHDSDYSESWSVFKQRAWQGFLNAAEYANQLGDDAHVVVFSSGGVISSIAGQLLGVSDKKIFELNFSMANSAMTHVKVKGSRHTLMTLSEHSYLHHPEQSLITWH